MQTLLKIVGLNLLQKNMLAREQRLSNRRKYHAAAVAFIHRWVQKNFEEQGKPAMGGSGWRPLRPVTLAHRRGGAANAKILQDTGQLKTRWKHLWDNNTGKLQSAVDYGMDHQVGRGWLPVRRILPLQKQVEKDLSGLLKKFISGGIS